jgi:hypothetical protein
VRSRRLDSKVLFRDGARARTFHMPLPANGMALQERGVVRMGKSITDTVVLEDGQSLAGGIQANVFVVKARYGSLKLPKGDTRALYFKNPPTVREHEVQVSESTRLSRDVGPAVIPVKLEKSGSLVRIPKSDIAGFVMFWGEARRAFGGNASGVRRSRKGQQQKGGHSARPGGISVPQDLSLR